MNLLKLARSIDRARQQLTQVPILHGAACLGKYEEDGDDVLVFMNPGWDMLIEIHVAAEVGGPLIYEYVQFFEKDGKRWVSRYRGTHGETERDEMIDSRVA